ncbi:membrane-attack complex/perforin family protein [Anaeromicropila herbilytica]|uniref:Uncharacterized protein n=1 Tax=Anaeromicropila herbilytica TaxID=2785025 RepID=A0A7R7EKB6_9FIRM|nr:hypothetical protein [Anaeromicropila herbilytica]BCN30446.1 hypothetical protein bsdtb5_17410 [Anaeromicropila herbilytica]
MNRANDKESLDEFNILDDLNEFDSYDLVDDTDDLMELINNHNSDYNNKQDETEETSNSEEDVLKSLDFLLDEANNTSIGSMNKENSDNLIVNDSAESVTDSKSDIQTGSNQMTDTDDDELFSMLDKMLQEEETDEKIDDSENFFDFMDDDILNDTATSSSESNARDEVASSIEEDSNNSEDIFSIDDLMFDEEETIKDTQEENQVSNVISSNRKNDEALDQAPNDISNIFSDVLSAVSSLEDSVDDEDDLSHLIPDIDEVKKQKKKQILNETQDTPSTNKKKGLFSKVFDNIKDETEEEYINRVKTEKEEADKKAKEKEEKAIELKEAKKIKDAEKKEEAKKKKAEKASAAKEAKARKAKEKADKRAKAEEEALYEYQGKINKVGASIVAVFFVVLAVVVIVGTNIFSYKINISYANHYYERQKFDQAYNELTGIKLTDKDKQLYKKVQTIMYVNKELNSYNSYYDMKKYPEALDSLLKGLVKYDKYQSRAKELGVSKDLDTIKTQLVKELSKEFRLSESDASSLNKIKDEEVYGQKVYDIASSIKSDKKVSLNK